MARARIWSGRGRMFLPALLLACAVIALSLLASNQGAAASSGATINIEIGDNFFNPKTVTANVGDTIVWTNNGRNPHDVTAGNGSFMSPRRLAPGTTFSYTVTTAGTFAYQCTIHVNHDGVLTVQAVAAPSAAPAASATAVPVAAPRTGGGGMNSTIQPWQQLLALTLLAGLGTTVLVGRRLRRAA